MGNFDKILDEICEFERTKMSFILENIHCISWVPIYGLIISRSGSSSSSVVDWEWQHQLLVTQAAPALAVYLSVTPSSAAYIPSHSSIPEIHLLSMLFFIRLPAFVLFLSHLLVIVRARESPTLFIDIYKVFRWIEVNLRLLISNPVYANL